jgi:hypothetical protein
LAVKPAKRTVIAPRQNAPVRRPRRPAEIVKRGKNDEVDAETICDAVARATMRFVPVKGAEQQFDVMLYRTRDYAARLMERGHEVTISGGGTIHGYRCKARRLSAISTSRSANWESRDEIECAKSRDFRPILAILGESGRAQEWLAAVNLPDTWVRADGVFPSIVDRALFERAGAIIDQRGNHYSDEELLSLLQVVLEEEGSLSGLIIDERDGMPSSSLYRHRFGSLLRAYSLIGYPKAIMLQKGVREPHKCPCFGGVARAQ